MGHATSSDRYGGPCMSGIKVDVDLNYTCNYVQVRFVIRGRLDDCERFGAFGGTISCECLPCLKLRTMPDRTWM